MNRPKESRKGAAHEGYETDEDGIQKVRQYLIVNAYDTGKHI
jgi:hypothetical protein